MYLSLTSWSFPSLTLDEATGVSKVLGIEAIDISTKGRPGLDKAEILADPTAAADRVRELDIRVANYYHHFGHSHADRNAALPEAREANVRDLAKVLAFADAADIATVFFLAGVINPGQSRRQAMEASADSIRAFLDVARDFNAEICVEPIIRSWAESPAIVRELVDRTGVRLALDYSHFICLGHTQDAVDPLAAHAAHIHLRQARMGKLQERFALGNINFPGLFGTLRDAGYSGALAIEYIHQEFLAASIADVMTESVTMRDCFRDWMAGGVSN